VSRFWRILVVILVVAFGVRVSYVAIAKRGPCPIKVAGKVVGSYPSACTVGDQIFYNAEANTIAHGHGFTEPLWSVTHPGQPAPPAADHPPLTVVVLAGVNWLVEHPPLSAVAGDRFDTNVREDRYAMVLFGTLLVFLVGLLGRRVGRTVPGVNGDVAGLIAAGIVALTPNVWVNDGLVMSETLTSLAVVGAILLAFALWDRPTLWRALALGACCGLVSMGRAELILFVPLLGLVVAFTAAATWGDRTAFAFAVVIAAAIVVAPWAGYNLHRFEVSTFVSTARPCSSLPRRDAESTYTLEVAWYVSGSEATASAPTINTPQATAIAFQRKRHMPRSSSRSCWARRFSDCSTSAIRSDLRSGLGARRARRRGPAGDSVSCRLFP